MRHKKKKFQRRKRRGQQPRFQHPRARFPRLKKSNHLTVEMLPLLRQMREDYPAPYYDQYRDGCFNPAERVIQWAINLGLSKLKERCRYHGLSEEGTRFDLVRAMYLHYRSGKLELGFPLVAYGKYHQNENPPQCTCGKLKKDPKKIVRFPRLPKRFPRIPKRFPRLLNANYDINRLRFSDPTLYRMVMRYLNHGKI